MSLSIALIVSLAFALCSRGEWDEARRIFPTIRKLTAGVNYELDQWAACAISYVEGVCKQGVGELEAAVERYSDPCLKFDAAAKDCTALRDLQALSRLHTVLILRDLADANLDHAKSLLQEVEPYCLTHANKSFTAAYYIIRSAFHDSHATIISGKQHLQQAITAGKAAANNQLLCIAMATMTHLYFTNIVGEQAEKSASVGRMLAKRAKSNLWLAVADGMYEEKLERSGKHEEAAAARQEAESAMNALPDTLRTRLVMREEER